MIHEITDENFESEVMDAGIPCVIEFTSDWCVLCKDMVPAFEKVAEELGDKVKFCSVDTGKQRKRVSRLPSVRSPTSSTWQTAR